MARRMVVVPYDPTWPHRFQIEVAPVVEAFGNAVRDCYHIGSTSVPGLPAKPTIDILVVVGGDRRLDDGLRALVLATREAMVNAAKHAGVEEVSVYAEIVSGRVGDDADDTVHVFVRDRGEGFDPAAVPADRHGLADSVHARMTRHGGTVRLRSTAGEGTEVHLAMPANGAVREETG